ncbi:hypothetical protein CYLTODRAFT_227320 [Cylindrobasidium torrendii FP15055 ss-10]|uniref:Uncharacterized protein n=1 Tax=Cylindrobasidium torrendii FP15055 ss-10 TaxID=1314674 RepID=A0A0D7BG41_9AGAR|nr:hypothetical protein CYLTODRAFT_227320 [Cylindrobasidium torrendii FP15055 ss-10]
MIAKFVKSLILTCLDPNIDWYTKRCLNLTHITVSPRIYSGSFALQSIGNSSHIIQRYPVSTIGAQLTSLSFPSSSLLRSSENIPTTVTHITFLGLHCDSGVDHFNINWTKSLRPLIGHVTHIAICIRDFNWKASNQLATLVMQCNKVLSYATLIAVVVVPVPAFIPEEALPDIARIGDAAGRRTAVFLLEQPFAEYSVFESVIPVERTRGSRGSFMGWERALHGEDDLWTRAQRIINGKVYAGSTRPPPSNNNAARM